MARKLRRRKLPGVSLPVRAGVYLETAEKGTRPCRGLAGAHVREGVSTAAPAAPADSDLKKKKKVEMIEGKVLGRML